jgi:RNA polymerase sigma factor (TIGR02999 family)
MAPELSAITKVKKLHEARFVRKSPYSEDLSARRPGFRLHGCCCDAHYVYTPVSTVESVYTSEPRETGGEITRLLHEWRGGSREAEQQLFALAFPNLRRLAHYLMQRERKDHSLQATELIGQIYFRMVAAQDRDWQNRQHFFAIAARAMRRYLIDHARGRPSAQFTAIEGIEALLPAQSEKIDLALTVDRLLDELAETKPEWSMLVEMKFFLGLNDEETAEAMGVKLRTMQRAWSDARRWLYARMETGNVSGAG